MAKPAFICYARAVFSTCRMEQLLILMVVVWTAGRLFQSAGLPLLFGEILAGIIVGPAMLDLVHPDEEVIRVIAELGIFFLMLHTGLKTDHRELFAASRTGIIVALGGMALSFIGGYLVCIAFGMNEMMSAFMGLGLSVSAIPLIARLFNDFGIDKTRAAHVTMGAAVFNDILALILFSLLLSAGRGDSMTWQDITILLLKVSVFFAVVITIGLASAPYLQKFFAKGKKAFTLTLIVALVFGVFAEWIGLHSIIGAFLAGVFMQEELIDRETFDKIEDRFYGLAYSFFGPVFFASLAFHLDFAALVHFPALTISIIAVAIVGKLVGSGAVALTMLKPVEAAVVGIAMNNRGAVELIIAAIGLEAGIIDTTAFSILVTMTFVTTMISTIGLQPFAKKLRAQEELSTQ